MSVITIKTKIDIEQSVKNRLFNVARQHNNTVRFCYNAYIKNPNASDTEINKMALSTMNNIPDIDNAWLYNCRKQAKSLYGSYKKLGKPFVSGGKKNLMKRKHGIISHEEYQKLRNSSIYWEGSKNYRGNRKFKLIDNGHSIEMLITNKERYILRLPKLHGFYKRYLEDLFIKANKKEIAITYDLNLVEETIYISFDLDKLYEFEKIKPIKDRVLGIDMNPNQICVSVLDKDKPLLKKSFILKNLQKVSRDKYKHEILEISKSVEWLAVYYQVEVVAVEELNMKSKDHKKGRNFNRLVNNFWAKKSFFENLKKRCGINGIHFQEVAPQYSSFIGQFQNPNEENGIAASMEIARRGNLFYSIFIAKRLVKEPILFPKFDKGFLITRWKKFKEIIQPCQGWNKLYQLVKNMEKSYRVSLSDLSKDRFKVFRFKSRRSCCETIVYT